MKKTLITVVLLSLLFSLISFSALAEIKNSLSVTVVEDSPMLSWISTKKFAFECDIYNRNPRKTVQSVYFLYIAYDQNQNSLTRGLESVEMIIPPYTTKPTPRIYIEEYQKAKYLFIAPIAVVYTDGQQEIIDITEETPDFLRITILR